jgi:5'-deoxynucleotidase
MRKYLIASTSNSYKANLHCHSTFSDGSLTVEQIKDAYKKVEAVASEKLLATLPDDLREDFDFLFNEKESDEDLWIIVKAADKLCAYLKCVEEYKNGNNEFGKALETTEKAVVELGNTLPEVKWFMENVAPSYEKPLDEL